ncbi:glycosyltransferase [Cellulomonas sp. JZ18]|uniref:glycosyltransferase n=1 Tax=Cellulomonas sp. JZ18 TaxID=2654191 RepID=UPI0018AF95B6|nr:glycosyltransferase [Cellulomonas sp. JZ18]
MSRSPKQEPAVRPGVVSVVVVNYRGADDTIACVRGLGELDWPADRLEVIVVENASGDDSAERIRAACPDVLLVEAGSNTGFAGGCNLGVAHASGEYVAFLNNDARPHPAWVSAAVAVLETEPDVGAVASKVLDWEGERIDYVDGSLTWFGMGYKREVEDVDDGSHDRPRDVLFGTGAAMFVRAALYREVGGFDERFFMFYEDVDLGWRLNLLGHRVRFVPGSLAYHKHHATMDKFGSYRESYLLERNALMSLYKNLDDASLARALPAAMALSVRRSVARTGTDATVLDLQRSPGGEDEDTLTLPKMALTGPFAIDYLVEQMPGLAATRAELQTRRRRTDRELFPLFRRALEPAYPHPAYVRGHDALVEAFGIAGHFVSRLRVLVVTGEPLTERIAGPAIRAWEIAAALSADHEVRLVSSRGAEVSDPRFSVEHVRPKELRQVTDWADVIVFQGFLLDGARWLHRSKQILVADVYDPMHLEQLEQARDLGPEGRRAQVRAVTQVLNDQLRRADFLLCASEKQRDFWLGQLAGVGRVNPAVYDEDASLDNLISIVPFGIPDEPPVQRRHAIKGTVPGIGPDDKVILWGGGIYNWFDPLTLVRAVARLAQSRPEVRLFFLGTKHPNPGVPEMQVAYETRRLADELGLTDRVVFFNDGWVPYAERADYLLDADVGVSTHYQHVETAYSFRTRILDYLWAGLPVVATDGDAFGELVRERGLGVAVPSEDVDALVAALDRMLFDEPARDAARSAVAAIAPEFAWSRTLAPLVEFCRSPRRAADLAAELGEPEPESSVPPPPWGGVRGDIALLRQYLEDGGVAEVVRRASGRVRRVVGR